MLDAAGRVWAKINEFVQRINALEGDSQTTKKDVALLEREVEIMQKSQAHSDKIVEHLSKAMAQMEQRVKQLEKDKIGKAISAGIAKKQVEKLKEELKARDAKRRH